MSIPATTPTPTAAPARRRTEAERLADLERGAAGRCTPAGLLRGLAVAMEHPDRAIEAVDAVTAAVRRVSQRKWADPAQRLAYARALQALDRAWSRLQQGAVATAALAADPGCAAAGQHHLCDAPRPGAAVCAPDLAEPGRHLCLSEEATRRECERSTDSGWRARFCQQLELSEPCRAVYQDALSRTDCARRREFLTRPTPDEPAPYEEKTPGCPRLPARAVRRALRYCYDGRQQEGDAGWRCPAGFPEGPSDRGCCVEKPPQGGWAACDPGRPACTIGGTRYCVPPRRRVREYARRSGADVPQEHDLELLQGLTRAQCEDKCTARGDECAGFTREVEDDEAAGFCWLKRSVSSARACGDCGKVMFRKRKGE